MRNIRRIIVTSLSAAALAGLPVAVTASAAAGGASAASPNVYMHTAQPNGGVEQIATPNGGVEQI